MSARAVAAALSLTCAALFAATVVFWALGGGPTPIQGWGTAGIGVILALQPLGFAAVGAVVALRQPANRIGWACLGIGLFLLLGHAAGEYGPYGRVTGSPPLPGSDFATWLGDWIWLPAIGSMGTFLLLLFPDGRLPSRRWRVVAWTSAGVIVLAILSEAFHPGMLSSAPGVANPYPVEPAKYIPGGLPGGANVLLAPCFLAAAASLVLRFRRARGRERLQIKWLASAAALMALLFAVAMVANVVAGLLDVGRPLGLQLLEDAVSASAVGLPLAIGIAVLRHRLYDIDVVINRTFVYGALTLVLAAAYGVTALVLGTALGQGSAWATAGATLVVAVAFRPVRRRLQDAVDRRFSRARYDALRRIATFLEELRAGRAAPEDVEPLLREVLSEPGLELTYFLPEEGLYVDARGVRVDDTAGDGRERFAIEQAGEPLAMVTHHSTGEEEASLLPKVVEAALLAIEIARLRVALRRQLAEVEASRARIVAATYEERRRIERDLHDGAQQRLISIGLALRHAQHEPNGSASTGAGQTLEGAVGEVAVAVEELRELARGVRPAQLDAGLAPALRDLADRAPFPVKVTATPERFDSGVEAAAYFIASEGLTNAVKHAAASRVALGAQRREGKLVVWVADDGVGGATVGGGTGLRGLGDRVAAHGGTLRIASARNAGTTLTAELPCES